MYKRFDSLLRNITFVTIFCGIRYTFPCESTHLKYTICSLFSAGFELPATDAGAKKEIQKSFCNKNGSLTKKKSFWLINHCSVLLFCLNLYPSVSEKKHTW